MSHLLLIHGAWGGSWEFEETLQGLRQQGHNATAVDLPGHGQDRTPLAEVTMDAYVERVLEAAESIDGPIVLVGHSLGGAIIAQVAERIPNKIDRLVFVAAMLPKTGDTPLGLMQSDPAGELLAKLVFSEDQSYVTVKPEDVRSILLNDVHDSDRLERFTLHFDVKQATQPFMFAAALSNEAFGSIPKTYVRAAIDKVLSPSLQDRMLKNWEVEEVFTLESGHFPLMSVPERLTDVLAQAARPATSEV